MDLKEEKIIGCRKLSIVCSLSLCNAMKQFGETFEFYEKEIHDDGSIRQLAI